MLPRFHFEGKTDVWISQVRRVKSKDFYYKIPDIYFHFCVLPETASYVLWNGNHKGRGEGDQKTPNLDNVIHGWSLRHMELSINAIINFSTFHFIPYFWTVFENYNSIIFLKQSTPNARDSRFTYKYNNLKNQELRKKECLSVKSEIQSTLPRQTHQRRQIPHPWMYQTRTLTTKVIWYQGNLYFIQT